MELNYSTIKTSNNYGINSIKINEKNAKNLKNVENFAINNDYFNKINIISDNNINVLNNADNKIDCYLNEEIESEIKNNSNLNLTLDVVKSSDKPTIVNVNFDEFLSVIDVFNLNIKSSVNSKIILKFTSSTKENCYHNLILKINLEDNSNTDVIFYSDLGVHSNSFISIESNLQKNAKLTLNIIDFALNNSIYNYKSKILGEKSISNINTLYFGNDNATIDLNYLIEIYKPFSNANMEIVGTVNDESRKHFKGTIDFKKGCYKSCGNENEFCMLLSNKSKSKALPMLLCTEEDVDGKHSSSVGKVNEKELFYIMSRGLSYEEARRLIVKAKCNNLINLIFDDNIKNEILNKIDGKI